VLGLTMFSLFDLSLNFAKSSVTQQKMTLVSGGLALVDLFIRYADE
jgi:hypothetical protein